MTLPHPPTADQVNQRLLQQYTEIATLAGGLAHEIKNPLSTIGLNLELLSEDFAEAETPRDRRALAKLAVIERECQRLERLLGRFSQLRQAPFAAAGAVRSERADFATGRFFQSAGGQLGDRDDLLSRSRFAQRGAWIANRFKGR